MYQSIGYPTSTGPVSQKVPRPSSRASSSASPMNQALNRRSLLIYLTTLSTVSKGFDLLGAGQKDPPVTSPKHLLSSSLFGHTPLEEILPIAQKLGILSLDVWPKIHGNQREQLSEMGESAFVDLLSRYECKLDCLTQYPLGPFGLADEMRLAQRLRCGTIVTGSGGPKGLKGDELKRSVRDFAEKMKPHLELAHACGVTIAIENHASSLLDSPDSMRWFYDMRPSNRLAIAFAPYHLPQDQELLRQLIRDVLPAIEVFYAWQHGKGCMEAQPKEDQRLQLPGRGSLDFSPLLAELKRGRYTRWTEVFMHPFPRGIPIADDLGEQTILLEEAKNYVDRVWQSASPSH
jgi:sugar phosphate isomerase/epimerase